MTTRVQVIVSDEERERFRRHAERRGLSLSAWMREAARQRAAEASMEQFRTSEDLRRFFSECDVREPEGREPDWERHRAVLEKSVRSGSPQP